MLNITELEKQFDEITASFTQKDIDDWLDFANQREMLDKLKNGESVAMEFDIHEIVFVDNILFTGIPTNAEPRQFAMAA